jgi:rSAM/selenodomain-associated transferase 1
MMGRRPAVVVFARAPVAGKAKTRLIPALGARRAAELYRCFVLDTLSRAAGAPAEIVVAAAEPEDLAAVGALAEEACPRAELIVQAGADLGERMVNAVGEALGRGHPRAVVIGTDSPDMPEGRLEQAIELTAGRDVVLGPCLDGGYYLVGLRAARRELFEGIRWSSEVVLSETLRRASEGGLSAALLEPWYDVDTSDELSFLRQHLTARSLAAAPMPCPRTWEYLSELPEELSA